MFLFSNTIRVNSKTIRGVRYHVFSHYEGDALIFERIGAMIEQDFNQKKLCENSEKPEKPMAKGDD
ncbi:hypothetical protein LJC34_01380 [Oscillospiraceae bacterium OttesenSCG-928-G22]|nr:hypothetical protein [Oscillospiraceae bacterium OttesenSCG-928-G22]